MHQHRLSARNSRTSFRDIDPRNRDARHDLAVNRSMTWNENEISLEAVHIPGEIVPGKVPYMLPALLQD